jgi:hypothetical protein
MPMGVWRYERRDLFPFLVYGILGLAFIAIVAACAFIAWAAAAFPQLHCQRMLGNTVEKMLSQCGVVDARCDCFESGKPGFQHGPGSRIACSG